MMFLKEVFCVHSSALSLPPPPPPLPSLLVSSYILYLRHVHTYTSAVEDRETRGEGMSRTRGKRGGGSGVGVLPYTV